MVAGVVYGLVHPKAPAHRQLVFLACVVPVTVLPFPFIHALPLLGLLSFISGFVISPTLITAFRLVADIAPAERLTEGLTLASTGIVFGVAVAAAASGRLVDAVGTPHAYVATTACGLMTALAAASGARRLHPAPT
jgi:predicted MFS family arabinose efflux permease